MLVRSEGGSFVGILRSTSGDRAWKALIEVAAVVTLDPSRPEPLKFGSKVLVYGGALVPFEDDIPRYDASLHAAFFDALDELVDVPVPPMLEAALDCELDGEWLGIWWDAVDAIVRCHNGALLMEASSLAWLSFCRHSRVAPFLSEYRIGDVPKNAADALLLDRVGRRIHIGPRAIVECFLRHFGVVSTATPLDRAFLFEILEECPELMASNVPGAAAVLAEYKRRAHALSDWLDAS